MIKTNFTRKENSDSGLALILILLIAGIYFKNSMLFKLAIIPTLMVMILPITVYPFTIIWLNVSDFLGKIISKCILAIIFIIIVYPIALVRKMKGKDVLQLRGFNKGNNSVFVERHYTFSKSDLTNPF